MMCVLCHGPIGAGEPVLVYPEGLAHRFRTTCEDVRELDAEFLKEVGVSDAIS